MDLARGAVGEKARPWPAATFMELLAPATSVAASCIVEVESQRGGKLRLELKGIATSEIAQLIHSFADQL